MQLVKLVLVGALQSMANKGQTVLDIVTALNREFRFNPSFMLMVHPLDDERARRVAQLYIEWINRVLQSKYEHSE
jgi:hypothetical protein